MRRHGWEARLTQHVLDAKVPVFESVRSAYEARAQGDPEYDDHDPYGDTDYVDAYWASRMLPPHIVLSDGLAHVTRPRSASLACNEFPYDEYGIFGEFTGLCYAPFQSTDEALAWYATRPPPRITCIPCMLAFIRAPYD